MLPGLYKCFSHWCNQAVWVYSDPHFGDVELQKGISNRPTDAEQIKMINMCVGKNDTLICLGDVGDIECVKKLRGYKVLICGNHDAGRTNYERVIQRRIFAEDEYSKEGALEEMKKLYPNCKYSIYKGYSFHSPFTFWEVSADNQLFDEVYEGALIIGEKLILSHEPVDIPWMFNIHGHDHKGTYRDGHLNVCADVIGYKPVRLNALLKNGLTSKIETIHRITIDKATERKKKNDIPS